MNCETITYEALYPSDYLYPADTLFPGDDSVKGVYKGMISFTDKRMYVKGTCQAILSDPCTGDVLYASNKFQTGNITSSVTMGEIRAGMGNAIATAIPSDAALNVEFAAADFSLFAKAAQLGATLSYSAPAPQCQVITATGSSLTIDTSEGAPVAQAGYEAAYCYVQETGASGTLSETGTAYSISSGGAISGFTSTSGKTYKVFYWVQQASAQIATIGSLMDPRILHFTAQMPVFVNDNCDSTESGNRVGWLYVIVPRLKLGGNGGVVGDQTNNDTTTISGQAIAYEPDVVSSTCTDCGAGELAYYIYVPENGADSIVGLAVVGGVLSVAKSSTAQIPVRLVMENGQLVIPSDYSLGFTYTASGAPSGTTVTSAGIVSAGSTAGSFDVTISYDNDGTSLTTVVTVTVS